MPTNLMPRRRVARETLARAGVTTHDRRMAEEGSGELSARLDSSQSRRRDRSYLGDESERPARLIRDVSAVSRLRQTGRHTLPVSWIRSAAGSR